MITRFVLEGPTIRILLYDLQPHPLGAVPERLWGELSSPPFMVSVTERHELAFKYAPVVDVLLLRAAPSALAENLIMDFRQHAPHLCILTLVTDLSCRSKHLQAGANLTLLEDVSLQQFQAGLQSMLRSHDRFSKLVRGPLSIHYTQKMVTIGSMHIRLDEKEMEVLYQLALQPGIPCSRQQLLQDLWGEHTEAKQRKVDAVVFTLRRKIGKHFIQLVRNHGYVFKC